MLPEGPQWRDYKADNEWLDISSLIDFQQLLAGAAYVHLFMGIPSPFMIIKEMHTAVKWWGQPYTMCMTLDISAKLQWGRQNDTNEFFFALEYMKFVSCPGIGYSACGPW